jgi:hypothetical protein
MKRFEFMNRGAMSALAALGLLAMCSLAGAQSVVITVNPSSATANGVPLCASAPVLGMDPAGGLTVTCTPVSTGGPPTIPSCTVPPATVQVGSTATVIANCGGGAISTYTWTNTNSAPGFAAALPNTASISSTGPFTTAMIGNTYSFSMTATNTAGTSPTATGTLTVNAASTAGCPTTPVNAVFTGTSGADRPGIVVGGFASYALSQFPAATNTLLLFTAVESNNTATGLPIEYTVSPCVGDFTSMPTVCTKFGTSNSGISLYAYEGNTARISGKAVCVMQPNTQYFLNVRTVKVDGTNSCTVSTCYLYVGVHLYTY